MLQKLRKLRTNENILIAVDVLINSKSAFMNIFLMAFMMRVSLSESPVDFIIYSMTRYACMGVFSILLMGFVRRHTLAAWRCDYAGWHFAVLCLCLGDAVSA